MTTHPKHSSVGLRKKQKLTSVNFDYQPELSKALESVNAGLILSYLIHLANNNASKEWLPITVATARKETGLSRNQQKTAINCLVKNGLVEVKKAGLPATRYFKPNLSKIKNLMIGNKS